MCRLILPNKDKHVTATTNVTVTAGTGTAADDAADDAATDANSDESTSTVLLRQNKQSSSRRCSKESFSSSWIWLYKFITNSFHGNLGMTSFFITLIAFIMSLSNSNSLNSNSLNSNSLYSFIITTCNNIPIIFIVLSIITTTILSIHSSYYMLQQSPYSSTILDYTFNFNFNFNIFNKMLPGGGGGRTTKSKSSSSSSLFNIKVVPPHRDAFHRTSIIMQYANTRILLLLQRQYYNYNYNQNNHNLNNHNQEQEQQISSSLMSLSGIVVWTFVCIGCIRMLPIKIPDIFSNNNNKINSDVIIANKNKLKQNKKMKMMPNFWFNGNTYCFVLPMMLSLVGDFIMTIYCEYHYYYYKYYYENQDNSTDHSSSSLSLSLSLYEYHTKYWLSLYHLLFLQLVAHIIAFSFTLIFRIRDKNKNNKNKNNKKNKKLDDNDDKRSRTNRNMSTIFNIRTLYWVCTIGVYALVIIGISKVRNTLQALHTTCTVV